MTAAVSRATEARRPDPLQWDGGPLPDKGGRQPPDVCDMRAWAQPSVFHSKEAEKSTLRHSGIHATVPEGSPSLELEDASRMDRTDP